MGTDVPSAPTRTDTTIKTDWKIKTDEYKPRKFLGYSRRIIRDLAGSGAAARLRGLELKTAVDKSGPIRKLSVRLAARFRIRVFLLRGIIKVEMGRVGVVRDGVYNARSGTPEDRILTSALKTIKLVRLTFDARRKTRWCARLGNVSAELHFSVCFFFLGGERRAISGGFSRAQLPRWKPWHLFPGSAN